MNLITRSSNNPILKPDRTRAWEGQAVFNGCPVRRGRKIYLVYRALSFPHYHTTAGRELPVSDIGIAESTDGVKFKNRAPFILPEEPWERFGCEDPRVTEFEEKYYIFYTALSNYPFSAEGIKVGVAVSRDMKTIAEKHLVTPFNAKAMVLLPERVNGKLCAILTAHTDLPPSKIAVAYFDKPEDMWNEALWKNWEQNLDKHILDLLRRPDDQLEVGAPPIKTKDGWLFFYSYIRGYRSGNPLFTIEAALLDLKDPTRIIARTDAPLMIPEEEYELYGIAPKIVFPSGILKEKKSFSSITAPRTRPAASHRAISIRSSNSSKRLTRRKARRSRPALSAHRTIRSSDALAHPWEAKAVFNPAAIAVGGKVHMLYRAMSIDNTSVFGYASSVDGFHFNERSSEPAYVPREPFEMKGVPGGNSGCEDPRLTQIGETIYMCYTAFNGQHPPQVALTSIAVKDFLAKRWSWAKPVLISPSAFDDKDAALFPEKVKGKYMVFHRLGDNIDIAFVPSLDFNGKLPLEEQRWLDRRPGFWDSAKVGISAPPVKTKRGWILLYHGVSRPGKYRVGAVVLDLKDPTKIIGRTTYPLFEPQMPYETKGQVPNVVFPCGNVVIGDRLFVYYGGGDSVVGVATVDINKLLKILL